MGLFDKMKEKIAPAQPSLMEEIPKAAGWWVQNMENFGYPLDGTSASFAVLDKFFEDQCKPGGLLPGKVRQMKTQLFAVGCYVGQVLVKELEAEWLVEEKVRDAEALIGVKLPDGRVARPVQRAIRCVDRTSGFTFVDFWDIVSNPPKPKEEGEETPAPEETEEGEQPAEAPVTEAPAEGTPAEETPAEETGEEAPKKKKGLFGRSKKKE